MTHARSQSGFTLVEVLIALMLSSVLFGATLNALDAFQRANTTNTLRNEASDNTRNAIDRLARQIRNVAAPSTTYAGALEEAKPYSITFQTIDTQAPPNGSENLTNSMRVRYCLDDSTTTNEAIWFQSKRWTTSTPSPEKAPSETACPDRTSGDWETTAKLANYLTNRSGSERALFEYGPSSSNVAQINSVRANVYLDVRPGQKPGETLQSTTIELRNANRQPVASFVATEINAGFILLDASSSEDPDGLALKYKWFENGAELETTSQKFETKKFESGSVHLYKLEVTDPGGLTSSVEHEVKIR